MPLFHKKTHGKVACLTLASQLHEKIFRLPSHNRIQAPSHSMISNEERDHSSGGDGKTSVQQLPHLAGHAHRHKMEPIHQRPQAVHDLSAVLNTFIHRIG
jgi:hypothetical protein